MKTAEEVTREIIDEHLCPTDPYTVDSLLDEDLGADSLDKVQLVMKFEDALDIEVEDAEIDKIKTVGQLVALVERHNVAGQTGNGGPSGEGAAGQA